MPLAYRRPGVYLEESLLISSGGDSATASTVAAFVGVAGRGPILSPVYVQSWSDYVTQFGDFSLITPPTGAVKVLSYLPWAVYSYFQNGGRSAYVVRATPSASTSQGSPAAVIVNGVDTLALGGLSSFNVQATSNGVWGNNLKYSLVTQQTVGTDPTAQSIFALQVVLTTSIGTDEVVETWPGLSINGTVAGSKAVDAAINDPAYGSQYISISGVNPLQLQPVPTTTPVSLAGGTDPDIPATSDLTSAVQVLAPIDGPLTVNIVGFLSDSSKENTIDYATSWQGITIPSTVFLDRNDVFVINDSAPPRIPGQTSSAYKTAIATSLGANTGDSYSASYGPWVLVPNPTRIGTTIAIPPGGAVMGVMARIDATVGVFRAPAGLTASISNAIGVQTKFSDSDLGDLNSTNINIIRPMVGSGVCIMGARTRKTFGADRYVGGRRVLIYVEELLRRTTQFAVFENNDQLLWSRLAQSAERILRPLWEIGGLRGTSATEAYFITCDASNNTPAVIQSGTVRMDVGIALEYPAEFIVIRLTQVDSGATTSEILPPA